MKLTITKFGSRTLRTKGRTVTRWDHSIARLMHDMWETTVHENGIGLAANQVGITIQLALVFGGIKTSKLIVNGKELNPSDQLCIFLLNPEIKTFGDYKTESEGCLSLKNMFADVRRREEVELTTFWDPVALLPQHTTIVTNGLTARAIQHEMDHLNGIMFTDHITAKARKRFADKIKKGKLK